MEENGNILEQLHATLDRAVVHFMKQEYGESIELCQQLLQKPHASYVKDDVQLLHSLVLFVQKNYARCSNQLKLVDPASFKESAPLLLEGMSYLQCGKLEQAKLSFQNVLQFDRENRFAEKHVDDITKKQMVIDGT